MARFDCLKRSRLDAYFPAFAVRDPIDSFLSGREVGIGFPNAIAEPAWAVHLNAEYVIARWQVNGRFFGFVNISYRGGVDE